MIEKIKAFFAGPVWRTIWHVGAAAAATYVIGVATDALSGGTVDPNVVIQGFLVAVLTAVVKALDPSDPTYGVGADGAGD